MLTSNSPGKTCFIGTRGHFSAVVFRVLLEQGVAVTQVFCAGAAPASPPETSLPVSLPNQEETLDSLAHLHDIPVQYITSNAGFDLLDYDHFEKPGFILVACFPFRLPESITHWPLSACLNIHPSLLPRYRGPDPIFWQLSNAERETGVSLHCVTNGIDTGPIVSQAACSFDDGASRMEIETALASRGAKLFTNLLTTKSATKIYDPQNESDASYQPMPRTENYMLSSSWSARHAFNFIQGNYSPGRQYSIILDKHTFILKGLIEYSSDGNLHAAYKIEKDELLIQFAAGILRVRDFTLNG